MKRFLLFAIMCVCVSIGAWADDYYTTLTDKKGSVKVARITLEKGGVLADALASISNLDQYQYIHISSPGTGATQITLTDDDITALSNLNAETIEMQKLNVSQAFTFSNSNVKYVILPDNWTKAQVKAAGLALSTSANFDAAISMSAGNASLNVTGGTEPSLVAYVNHAGTLRDALLHNYWDQQDYKTIGQSGDCSKLRKLIVMGNTCAKDISRAGVYDANGHYVTNGLPDENSQDWNRSTEGGNYYIGVNNGAVVSTAVDGAISGCYGIYVIDLSEAYVPDEYCTDIVVGFNGIGVKDLREVWMPQDSRFHTVPADYLNINTDNLHQICIPGNIETIKTRAFAAQGTRINYIWTTGPEGNTKYDNGAAFVTGDKVDNAVTTVKFMDPRHDVADEEWVAFNNPADYNNFQYGTITLPANLKLIERFAFAGCTSVSDVYVLNATAPECHVDAFSTNQYDANNTVAPGYVKDGIVTRDAYRQGDFKEFKFMTILHYPVATTDPDIQRYTDPTREYSIATGERDDKGNTIYFPNHSEVSFAYLQGSYGYVWKAWNDDRNWYDQSLKQGYGSGWPLDKASHVATSEGTRWQGEANTLWKNNPYTDAKKDRSFYDVTTGSYNQTGEVTAPAGLDPYYDTTWNDHQLYPQPKSEISNFVYVRDDNGDYVKDPSSNSTTVFRAYAGSADDQLARYSRKQDIGYYSCPDGRFVQDYSWTKDDAGLYILDGEYTLNTTGGGAYVLDYTWVRDDANGTHYHPLVSTAFPGNEWGELPNGFNAYADYWYPTFRYDSDPNGEYVEVYGEYYTDATVPSWHASVYEQNKAAGMTYSRTLTGYNQCNNNEEVKNHKAELFTVGDTYALLTSDVKDFVNGQKFARNPIAGEYREYNPSTDEGCDRYDITGNGFVLAVSPADDSKQHYTKSYVANSYREFDSSRDKSDEPLYCYGESDFVSDTPITYTVQNDYRGWHQFVLTGYSSNTIVPYEYLRSFISDNEWWTICEPFDLRYSDMVMFFGTKRQGFDTQIPYLSKLTYVVRDVENRKITLMFSKNLMEYKEHMPRTSAEDPIVSLDAYNKLNPNDKRRHGVIADDVKWTAEELAEDPIILHAGVPYLIKPHMMFMEGTTTYNRQFSIAKRDNPDLFRRLKEAEEIPGHQQMDMIYDGEYTVPTYVVGYSAEGAAAEGKIDAGTMTIVNEDGSSFTYKDSQNGGTPLTYGGKTNVPYKISNDYTYSFVGTYYKSVMPQYCYFLGWDSSLNGGKGGAAFWYSRVQDKSGWNWNNETGIIIPNWVKLSDAVRTIHPAASISDPARWLITNAQGVSAIQCDDFPSSGTTGGAKNYTMDFGGTNFFEIDEEDGGVVTEIDEVKATGETSVYSVNGVYMGNSVKGLAKGLYIVNGQKYVVK